MFLFELLIWDLIGLSNILIIVSMAKDINWLIYSCAWMLSCKLWKALHVICISIYIQTLSVHFFLQTVKLLKSSSIEVDKANLKKASSLIKKHNNPGYALCLKVILLLFTDEELALSRGQGLIKAKHGDMRPCLNKEKVQVMKGEKKTIITEISVVSAS